jgi:hypothetical protein
MKALGVRGVRILHCTLHDAKLTDLANLDIATDALCCRHAAAATAVVGLLKEAGAD